MLRGVALAATAYEAWPLRHCHDLDLLVDAEPGAELHASGFPVARHVTLYQHPECRPDLGAIRARTVEADVAGVAARVLGPADTLVHVVGHAATTVGPSLRWAPDAVAVLRSHGEIDWDVVAEHAGQARLAAVVSTALRWLDRALGAPVPRAALMPLDRAASRDAAFAVRLAAWRAGRRAVLRAALPRP